MPLESCQKYTATLSEILALTPVVQTIADATDVPGVRLEWLNGAWYGDCGFPSTAQHSALIAANAYNSLGVGARATVNGSPVTWRGAVDGWGITPRISDFQPVGTTIRATPLSTVTTKTAVDTRKAHEIYFDCSVIRIVYRNGVHDGTTFGELTNLSAIGAQTINASIEYSGKNIPIKFNGSKTVTLQPGEFAISDPLFIGLVKSGTVLYTRTHCVIAGGLGFAGNYGGYRSYEGVAYNGADLSGGIGISGYTASTGDMQIAPFAILTKAKTESTLFLGDSITYGVGDTGLIIDPNPPVYGWCRRACSGKMTSYVAGYPGGTLEEFLDFSRTPGLNGILPKLNFTQVCIAFGANDCLTKTFAQMKTNISSAIANCKNLGISRVIVALILPRTSSTDSWATLENQTPLTGFEIGGVRDQTNAWILSGCDGLASGYVDTLTSVSSGSAWIPGYTGDGAHPNASGHAAIAGNAAFALLA